jgi:enoyl-[acyl-carrier-protein] reductase (NADH)
LLERVAARHLVSIEGVGATTAFLSTDFAKLMTRVTVYADGEYHIVG